MNTETFKTNIALKEEITKSWDFINEDDWSEIMDYFPGDYD